MPTGSKICVVDAEPMVGQHMQLTLEEAGHLVDFYDSVGAALDADLEFYELYIIDVMMEEREGLTLARYLKENLETAARPVIFCASHTDSSDMIQWLEEGADGFIAKPFATREFTARVNAMLRRRQIRGDRG